MTTQLTTTTFPVADVEPTKKQYPTIPYRQAVTEYLRSPVESCSKYDGRLVEFFYYHPLVSTIHLAFCEHRPICLSPDTIWLTILQGLAIHINENAEELRRHFVRHEGKIDITVRRDDFVKGSPHNPWPEGFTEFASAIRSHIGEEVYDLIVADFSTTGPVERAASEIALMDSMQSYFSYRWMSVCGIPEITLEGTVADWEAITARVAKLAQYGLEWWVEPLQPVLSEFVAAVKGNVNRAFWDSIYKYYMPGMSGATPEINGWVTVLFPYLVDYSAERRRCMRNPYLSKRSHKDGFGQSLSGPDLCDFPKYTAKVPFVWDYFGAQYSMEFIGGLIGIHQNEETLCLRPEIGWAVRDLPT